MDETVTKTEKLVGKYFHSANENNKVEWQGVVIGEPHAGWYLVQLFDWASGEPSVERLVPIFSIGTSLSTLGSPEAQSNSCTTCRLVSGPIIRLGFRRAKRGKTCAYREDGRLVILS